MRLLPLYSFGRVLRRLVDGATILGGLAVVLMMLHVTADVLLRKLFAAPLPGTLAVVSNYYMVVLAFVPLALAERRRAHIAVEVLVEHLPHSLKHWLARLVLLPVGAALAVFAWRTWEIAGDKLASGTSIVQGTASIVVWPSYFALPIGAGLMLSVVLYRLTVTLVGAANGLDEVRDGKPKLEPAGQGE